MEHKLITGGEQWLPFARSRIKALRATGLSYACQKYEIEGARVEVRIAGEHEYIRLEGGFPLLSGATREGTLVAIPPFAPPAEVANYTLRSFRPTDKSLKYTSFKPRPVPPEPTAFHDEDRLGVIVARVIEPLRTGQAQTAHVCGSMYSGRMAKLVQLLLGYGKVKTKTLYPNEDETPPRGEDEPSYTDEVGGVRIRYDHRWACCHGIVVAADDSLWLVEISQVNGVIAMPLPMLTKTSSNPEVQATFGGWPSGGTFPKDIAKAIDDGKVIRLATATDLLPIYTKINYSPDMGWTFPDNGRVAYNTCRGWHATEMNRFGTQKKRMAYLYRMDIEISGAESPSGSATLVLQEEVWARVPKGPNNVGDPLNTGWSCPFVFQDSARNPYSSLESDWVIEVDESLANPWELPGFPIFVRHRKDKVDIIRIKSLLASGAITAGAGIESEDFGVSSFEYEEATREYGDMRPGAEGSYVYYSAVRTTGVVAYAGFWAYGARDAYVAVDAGYARWGTGSTIQGVTDLDNPFGVDGSGTTYTNTFPNDTPNTHPLDFSGRPVSLSEAYSITLIPGPSLIDKWDGPQGAEPRYMCLVLPDETIKVKSFDYDLLDETPEQRVSRFIWRGDLIKSYSSPDYFPRFYIRHSTFGPSFHAVYSEDHILSPDDPLFGTQKFIGPLLEDEDPASDIFYSFVGHLT